MLIPDFEGPSIIDGELLFMPTKANPHDWLIAPASAVTKRFPAGSTIGLGAEIFDSEDTERRGTVVGLNALDDTQTPLRSFVAGQTVEVVVVWDDSGTESILPPPDKFRTKAYLLGEVVAIETGDTLSILPRTDTDLPSWAGEVALRPVVATDQIPRDFRSTRSVPDESMGISVAHWCGLFEAGLPATLLKAPSQTE